MKRARSAAAVLLIAALTLSAAPMAFASTDGRPSAIAEIDDRSPAAEAAFRDVTRCLNSGQNPSLSVAYLVDLSDSVERFGLADTVETVLGTSVNQLSRFLDRVDEVSYSIVGFGSDADVIVPWTAVDGSDQSGRVQSALTVASVDGATTNYLVGLRSVQEQLELQSDSCRMLVWMTDGAINTGGSFESVFPSLEEICRPGISAQGVAPVDGRFGLMQEFRDAGVPVFGVFFTNQSLRDELLDFERWKIDFLRPIVEGRGEIEPVESELAGSLNGYSLECAALDGDGVAIDGGANGALIESEDPVALAFDFLRLEAGLFGGSGSPVGDDGIFIVPPGTAYFRVILPSSEWTLTDPSGTAVPPAEVLITEAGGATSIEVEVDDSGWGEWRVESPGPAITYLFTGLTLRLDRELGSSILSGVENTVTGQVVPEPGRDVIVDGNLVRHFPEWGSASPVVVSGDSAVNQRGTLSDTGVFEVTGLIPSTTSGEIELRVALPLGGEFEPIESTFRLTIEDSTALAFPLEKSVELTPLVGPDGVATGVVTIRPPTGDSGPAQLCILPGWDRLTDKPAALNEAARSEATFERSVGSADGCFDVLPDTPLEITVAVGNPEQLNSRVDAAVTIESRSSDGALHSEPLLISFDSRTQQNPWIVAAAIVVLLVLGLGLPLLALWLWNRAATRFAPVDGATRAAYPVRIQRGGRFAIVDARRGSEGQKITVAPNDFGYVTSQPTSTTFDTQKGVMHARVPWFPLAASWFEWVAPEGHRIVSIVPGSTKQTPQISTHHAVEVSPDVSRSWAIVVSETALVSEESDIEGELILFSPMQSDVRQYQRRVDDIVSTPGLSEAMDAAAHAARSVRTTSSDAPRESALAEVGVRSDSAKPVTPVAPLPPRGAPSPPGGAPQPPSTSNSAQPSDSGKGAPPPERFAPPPASGPLAPPPPPG